MKKIKNAVGYHTGRHVHFCSDVYPEYHAVSCRLHSGTVKVPRASVTPRCVHSRKPCIRTCTTDAYNSVRGLHGEDSKVRAEDKPLRAVSQVAH